MKLKVASLALALVAFAAPSFAQSINKSSYQAKSVPSAGSAGEADMCLAATALVTLAADKTEGADQSLKDSLMKALAHWVGKSAAAHGKSSDGYLSSQPVVDMIVSVADVDMDTHVAITVECIGRM